MTKGKVGVWNGPKKDNVIYEQPLTLKKFLIQGAILLEKVETEKWSKEEEEDVEKNGENSCQLTT